MSRVYKLLGDGQLYRAEHKELGTWWFTDVWKATEYCGVSYSTFYLRLKGRIRSAKGWEFTIVGAGDCTDKNRIDPK